MFVANAVDEREKHLKTDVQRLGVLAESLAA
jgi:hypothetical protein